MARSTQQRRPSALRASHKPATRVSPESTPSSADGRRASAPPSSRRTSRGSPTTPPIPMDVEPDDPDAATPTDANGLEIAAVTNPPRGVAPFPGFRKGNLVKVEMKNFLTFSHTSIFPGPKMNLIIGPNGTGKSTVCNAVCIVFAGNPKILGRATDLGAFVKHGEEMATIEALVYDPDCQGGVQKVKTQFDCAGHPKFFLNGRKVNKSVIKEVNAKYDIQLDNLSQFMPQEKIAEFTQLKPDELLAITVRSLGGTGKEDEFHRLIKQDVDISTFTKSINAREEDLATLLRQHEAEAAEVEAYRQQQKEKQLLEVYKKYLPILQAGELKAHFVGTLHDVEDVEQELAALKASRAESDAGPINQLEQQLQSAILSFQSAKEKCKSINSTAFQLVSNAQRISLDLTEKEKSLREVEQKAARKQEMLDQAEQKLADATRDLEDNDKDTAEEELNKLLHELDSKRRSIKADMSVEADKRAPLEQKKEEAARMITYVNGKLRSLADVRQQRISDIAGRTKTPVLSDCDRLVHEMKANRAFRGDVCGPMAAEIEVEGNYHARIMEASVTGFYMSAFVTEYSSDSRLLIQECKQRFRGWAPDVITAPTTIDDEKDLNAIAAQVPRRPVDERLRSLGIECMVDNIYKCPEPVRAALNAQTNLHTVYVGNERSEACRGQLQKEEGVDAWFSPKSRCQIIRSRYDRNVRNLRVDTQFASRNGALFAGNSAQARQEKERCVARMQEAEGELRYAGEEMKAVEARIQALRDSYRGIDQEVSQLFNRKKERQRRQDRVDQATRHVYEARLRVQSMNVQDSKEKLQEEVVQMEEEGVETIFRATKGILKTRKYMAELDEKLAQRTDLVRRLEAEKSKVSELESDIRAKEDELRTVKDQKREAKKHWKDMARRAEKAFTDEEKAENAEILAGLGSKTVEELENDIVVQNGKVAGLATGGPDTIRSYEHRQRKIDRAERELEGERQRYNQRIGGFRSQKERFLSWLDEGVQKMRAKFSRQYRRLGCAGDLELVNKDSERIGDLQLQILVSYRDDAVLRPISASANSGGEKMCCTMLFCFSLLLEEERMPPFVFVDELNQGLDPSNEMKIMTMMFKDAEEDSAPQSFVITPKLLLNLPFHSRTKTHIIFNGSVTGKLADIAAPQV